MERRKRERDNMRATTIEFFNDMDEQGSTMAMDVDDMDLLEILDEGIVFDNKLANANFFNSFEYEFDDSNIN